MNARLPGSADNYLGAFKRVCGILPGQQAQWMQSQRNAAIGRFARRGFPGRYDEDWKYTPVTAIEQGRFSVLPTPCPEFLGPRIAAHALPDAHLLVFVNGHLEPGLCRLKRLPKGVVLGSLAYLLDNQPERLEHLLRSTPSDSAFSDLNLAFMADGAFLHLPADTSVSEPIQWLYITGNGNPAIQSRNIIEAGANSAAIIVEQHLGGLENACFTNNVTDVHLAAGTRISHYKLQQENRQSFHIAAVNVSQERKSRFQSSSFALGARLSRVAILADLRAEEAACALSGLYLLDGHQHADHHLCVDHRRPGGSSHVDFKGILRDAARAVFAGQVTVHPHASGSATRVTNQALLLSENAELVAQPQLDIRNNDVECSQAATIGRLDPEQLRSLQAQGIADNEARATLSQAFAMEMIHRVSLSPLQAQLATHIRRRLSVPG